MKYLLALLVVGLCTGCAGTLKTNVSPVADIANAGGKIEDSGQAIFQATIKARAATPNLVPQKVANDVALAVNKLGHAGLTLNAALTAYNVEKAAGRDVTAQRDAIQQGLAVVERFLTDITVAVPANIIPTVNQLLNTIIDAVTTIRLGTGL